MVWFKTQVGMCYHHHGYHHPEHQHPKHHGDDWQGSWKGRGDDEGGGARASDFGRRWQMTRRAQGWKFSFSSWQVNISRQMIQITNSKDVERGSDIEDKSRKIAQFFSAALVKRLSSIPRENIFKWGDLAVLYWQLYQLWGLQVQVYHKHQHHQKSSIIIAIIITITITIIISITIASARLATAAAAMRTAGRTLI